MRNEVNRRFCFLTDFYDSAAALVRLYQLFYYSSDGAIEMYDPKNLSIFLKRIRLPTVSFQDLYKGNEVNIYSLLHKIINYGDEYTRKYFEMSKENAALFYAKHKGKPFYDFLIDYITSDFIVGMELIKENAIKEWRNFIGPTNVEKAKKKHHNNSGLFLGKG